MVWSKVAGKEKKVRTDVFSSVYRVREKSLSYSPVDVWPVQETSRGSGLKERLHFF